MITTSPAVAVIGIACRYPGADSPRALWENVLARRQQFRAIPDCRLPISEYHSPDRDAEDRTYGKRAALIDGWSFDPIANRVPKVSFESTDVVHWLTLDIARRAVQQARLDLGGMNRDRIGMILGNTLTGEETRSNILRLRWPFLQKALRHAASVSGLGANELVNLEAALEETWKSVFPKITEDSLAGGLANTIAGRVCNVLDLRGGGYVVDGACSSSLLALATAAEMVANGKLEIALAGGVDISLDPFELVGFAKATALAEGEMNVYDKRGKGFIPGEGCGVVVLQGLEQARREGRQVLAVIRGWGISSDGKGGITAPSSSGQMLALRRAYELAGYSPHSLDFVEGHGTGTAVGDRVELEGISLALKEFGNPVARSVGVTSFKSIVGHTKAAAGIGGFIKAVLAVNQRVLPPTAGCALPNESFDSTATALYPLLNAEFRPATDTLRAGVSAMGFGGINSHVTLESGDPPSVEFQLPRSAAAAPHSCEVFPLTAATAEQLLAEAQRLASDVSGISRAEMADLSADLGQRTELGAWRACVVAGSVEELESELATLIDSLSAQRSADAGARPSFSNSMNPPRCGFLFPGQGSQLLGMGAKLAERYAWAQERVKQADALLSGSLPFSQNPLSQFMIGGRRLAANSAENQLWQEALRDTRVAQPAIVLASALWFEYLARLGIHPTVVGGHSLGELSALHAAGAFDFPTLMQVAALRGRLMAAPSEEPGTMAALRCDGNAARELAAGTDAVVANLNAPDQTVISGSVLAVDRVVERATSANIRATKLAVANAFHSPMMGPASTSFEVNEVAPRSAQAFRARVLSAATGAELNPSIDLRKYIAAQILEPVDFISLASAIGKSCDVILEVGSGGVLSDLVRRSGGAVGCHPLETNGDDRATAEAVAMLFLMGARVQWAAHHEGRLVRPFVPARARVFYTNPCERPFPRLVGANGIVEPPSKRLHSVPEIHRRSPSTAPRGIASRTVGATAAPRSQPGSSVAGVATDTQGAQVPLTPEAKAELVLFEAISATTGFPVSSLNASLRLLDDLNLDSIKAGALLADTARQLGRPSPTDLANATLGEIVARFAASSAPPRARPSAEQWVASFVTDWNPESLNATASSVDLKHYAIIGDGTFAEELHLAMPHSTLTGDSLLSLTAMPSHVLLVLPEATSSLERHLQRIATLNGLVTRFGQSNLASVTFVQQLDGRFGQAGETKTACSVRSFAASLGLEMPTVRVRALDIHPDLSLQEAAAALLQELLADSEGVVGIGSEGQRMRPCLRRIDALDARGDAPGSIGGVALVTGGAKGITAQCARALARDEGCQLVLVGSSEPNEEVNENLKVMAEEGIVAEYRRCDVTDRNAVRELVAAVRQERGPITVVLHGAGLNRPKAAVSVSLQEALLEIGPKVGGCANLIEVLRAKPPIMFIALTSVIGVLGMAGNAWYALANETVDLSLRSLAKELPQVRTLALAYSVWDEVGMGVKLGSVQALANRGISAIPVEQGVHHFRRWLRKLPPDQQVVITGRMGLPKAEDAPEKGRFLGTCLASTPGVEHVAKVHLNTQDDSYVLDHDFRGSLLFPTVMGLEAMGQVAKQATGATVAGDMRIENITLEHPIVVHPIRGEHIEIRAMIRDRDPGQTTAPVHVGIYCESSEFARPHFRASFTFGPMDLNESRPTHGDALDIEPRSDLYGGLLFQGPLFQRITRVLDLNGSRVLFESEAKRTTQEHPEGFSELHSRPLVAGDPYFRDTLLQALQLVVSPNVALPVGIDRMEVRDPRHWANGPALVEVMYLGREGDILSGEVRAWDRNGVLVERISGYRAQVLELDERHPEALVLATPSGRDERIIQSTLDTLAARHNLVAPRVKLQHVRGMHERKRQERRLVTEPLLAQVAELCGVQSEVIWREDGSPRLTDPELGLSLTHDDDSVLAVAGKGPQGCDLVARPMLDEETWRVMLPANQSLFAMLRQKYGPDVAGRFLWAAQEATFKCLGEADPPLALVEDQGGKEMLFRAKGRTVTLYVGATRVSLARGGERTVAACLLPQAQTVERRTTSPETLQPTSGIAQRERSLEPRALEDRLGSTEWQDISNPYAKAAGKGARIAPVGPGGQLMYSVSDVASFRTASEPSGNLRYSYFVDQMGRLRELAAEPILSEWTRDFLSGKWGAVTNQSRLTLEDTATVGDTIEGSVWCEGVSGEGDSTIHLAFSWHAVRASGERQSLARGQMSTTWVEIVGHGEVRPAPAPAYQRAFCRLIEPRKSEPIVPLPPVVQERGRSLLRFAPSPTREPQFAMVFKTSRGHSNIVGNIYFAHYAAWQAEILDCFLAEIFPPLSTERRWELRANDVEVLHLREAMPFQLIEAVLYVEEIWQQGLNVRVEFFHKEGERRVKLALGMIRGTWFSRDSGEEWKPAALPEALTNALWPAPVSRETA